MLNSVIHFIKTTIEHYIIQPCKLKVKICSKLLFEIYVKTRPKRKYFTDFNYRATGKLVTVNEKIMIATEIPTDFETAGAAVGEVNTRFGLTGQALDDLSARFIKFAQLNDTDVSTSIDNVSSVMNAFGINRETFSPLFAEIMPEIP
jgi:hypothetical protein